VLTNCEKYVSDVRATSVDGKELRITHVDAHGWLVDNPSKGAVAFTYRVLGDEPGLGSDRVHVDRRSTFVNGPAALMYLKGRITDSTKLTIEVPEKWDVATAMVKQDGKYVAADYDELIDSPIQLGIMQRKSFQIGPTPFEVVYVSKNEVPNADLDFETNRIKILSKPALKLFGAASFKKYLYIIHISNGIWEQGLEHCASTVLDVTDAKPLNIDELVTHEYFHAWNVKQIRPKVLGPFDYTQPCRTKNLWFAEGVTDYYGYLCVYRSGLQEEPRFLYEMSREVSTLQRCRTRLRIPLDKACFETWEHGGFGYDDLSYYNKGLLVGLILDAAIIESTDGAKSLDDVMRSMYAKYRMPHAGFEEDAILKEVNTVAGKDLTQLYDSMVGTVEELPYDVLQSAIGIRVLVPGEYYYRSGFTTQNNVVKTVEKGLIGDGLHIGDEVVTTRRPNQQGYYEVDVLRSGKAITVKLQAIAFTASAYVVERDPFASAQIILRRSKWLSR
jgi:predicted metalloprotease with PDZ domain